MGSGGLALKGVQIFGIYMIIMPLFIFLIALCISEQSIILGTEQSENIRREGGLDFNSQVNQTLPGTEDSDIPEGRSLFSSFFSLLAFDIGLSTDHPTFMSYWWIIRLLIVYLPLILFSLSVAAVIWI